MCDAMRFPDTVEEFMERYKVPRCSECGFEYGTVATLFKFCPYCGASMMKGAEDAGRNE